MDWPCWQKMQMSLIWPFGAFSGFSALFPVIFAALYWKRTTEQGCNSQYYRRSINMALLFS